MGMLPLSGAWEVRGVWGSGPREHDTGKGKRCLFSYPLATPHFGVFPAPRSRQNGGMARMKQDGIASPLVLIVLLLVLGGLAAGTAYLALSSYKGSRVERTVYQAFLAAESALDAFPVAAREAGCGGLAPAAYTLALPGGSPITARYTYSGLVGNRFPETGGVIAVEARASLGGAVARVERSFRITCGILGAVPAALTSRPRVEVRGNAQVIGERFAGSTGLIPRDFPQSALTRVSLPTGQPSLLVPLDGSSFNLTVGDASLIPVGGYIQIPTGGRNKTYRVEARSGNTLTLTPMQPEVGDALLPLAPVGVVEYGVRRVEGNTLTLSNTRGLLVGQRIRVKGSLGTIQSLDHSARTATVVWEPSPPSWTQADEGAPLIPEVVGAASHLNIEVDGNSNVQNGSLPYSPLVSADRDALFQNVFGMSREEFLRLYPPIPASSFSGTLSGYELKVVRGPLNLTGNTRICGEGLLVVIGELTVNGSCDQGFRGLIYVAGDYDQQGNASISGSVVVEGQANIECNAEDCWTNIAGTQAKSQAGKIVFDPLVLYRLRMAAAGSILVTPEAGTWRRK